MLGACSGSGGEAVKAKRFDAHGVIHAQADTLNMGGYDTHLRVHVHRARRSWGAGFYSIQVGSSNPVDVTEDDLRSPNQMLG